MTRMPSIPTVFTRTLAVALLLGGAGMGHTAAPDPPIPVSSSVPGIVDAPDARAITIATTDGPVRGVASPRGQVFLGIPFAAPPIGELRFAPPAPVQPWREARDARRMGLACLQPSTAVPAGEDCLNLTVFAPHDANAASRLPVMVWLYGGGLTAGSNAEVDASDLAERQHVIVVAPNYRLGVFGFLAHPALKGPGEGAYASLDQQAALKWVQRNIARFGGDAGRVTLFGVSAGAQSACVQLALKDAGMLIHGAILQSDTCIMPDTWTPQAEAEVGGMQMATDIGCARLEDAAACLRRVPAGQLLAAASYRRGNAGTSSWAPMVGGDVLPKSPRQLFAEGKGARIPVLIGNTRNEGNVFADRLVSTGMLRSRAGYEFKIGWAIQGDSAPVIARYADVANHSFAQAYAELITASHFACPVLSYQRLMGDRAPIYAYEFDDPHTVMPLGLKPNAPLGAFHGGEVAYVFHRPQLLAGQFDAGQRELADRMQAAWASFARTGKPGLADGRPWPVFNGHNPVLLAPDRRGTVPDFAERHRCAFWNARGY